jgi:hypothetical protein
MGSMGLEVALVFTVRDNHTGRGVGKHQVREKDRFLKKAAQKLFWLRAWGVGQPNAPTPDSKKFFAAFLQKSSAS